ncbi:PREDICTED: membrane cofactor protein-like, partial [Buceros rhinoceros silvestris]|uniref:membrane cofactor protein-like n=1 Tax=Buceros rhinoceros silvestris TaxID=175836 RepID=UPI000528B5EA
KPAGPFLRVGDSEFRPVFTYSHKRKCPYPGELASGFINVTDLTVGSKAILSCQEGYRLRGDKEIVCELKGDTVAWNRDLPFCERIPCQPPPSIAHGRYTALDEYLYGTTVTYSCDAVPKGADPFSLIGTSSIVCMGDANLNGVWSAPPPQCKVVKCENPKIENGKKKSGFRPFYTYQDSVMFECDPGYVRRGAETITCGENSTWSPPKPTCEKLSAPVCAAPEVMHGVVIPAKFVYEEGESVQIKCGPESSALHINNGRVTDGQKSSYSVGDFITIECYAGYTLHGEARIQYIGENRWSPGVPTCQLSAYITAIICVIVAIVVFLAAFWVYKKFFSQNGKRDSTPCSAEYKICKA